jgi:hypothetical protein
MKQLATLVLLGLALALVVGATPTSAQSGDFQCLGRPAPGTVIPTNVIVPSGAVCELLDVKVLGNVFVLPGGALRVGDDVPAAFDTIIFGNVEANGAQSMRFGAGNVGTFSVRGNADIRGTTGVLVSPRNFICNGEIRGDLRVEDSTPAAPFQIGSGPIVGCADGITVGGTVEVNRNAAQVDIHGLILLILSNDVIGNVYVFDNTNTVTINGNRIDGNLKCERNTAVVKGVNIIGGNDECPAVP